MRTSVIQTLQPLDKTTFSNSNHYVMLVNIKTGSDSNEALAFFLALVNRFSKGVADLFPCNYVKRNYLILGTEIYGTAES